MGEKLTFMWSRDQCSAKRDKRLRFSVGLGFGIGLGLWYEYDSRFGVLVWVRIRPTRVLIQNQDTKAVKVH